ncbi:putative esterase [Belliella baltica DSM 15883]|uniref:Putative esterase n=1 Tax=Belliella baltica (strain DSM 15883 / CIP 108006 / LMG 21964 / BA134) TaxID=866536 RepID=I3Z4I1_BELBD|nr:alpha/beta hydrolase [Belliella baltica]AFL84149.1 putative esterase [Belliella baltica DSM 15883]
MKFEIAYKHTAQYHLSQVPTGKEKEVWILFHGYGQLAEYFLRKFKTLFSENRLFVVPEATNYGYLQGFQGRVGANWMTKHERELAIDNNHQYLNKLLDHILEEYDEIPKINVLGFSQGAATASRWLGQVDFSIGKLILWGGGFAHDLNIGKIGDHLKKTSVTLVLGDEDEFITKESIQKQDELISVLDIQVDKYEYPGGHELHLPTLEKLIE